jgi:hypothetical protein
MSLICARSVKCIPEINEKYLCLVKAYYIENNPITSSVLIGTESYLGRVLLWQTKVVQLQDNKKRTKVIYLAAAGKYDLIPIFQIFATRFSNTYSFLCIPCEL